MPAPDADPTAMSVIEPDPPAVEAEAPTGDVSQPDPPVVETAPGPGDVMAGLVDHTISAVAAASDPLDAEWVLCRLLAMIEIDAPEGVTDQQRTHLRTGLLADLVDGAAQQASAGALALLRVCAVLGPVTTRAKAAGAAVRLVASGREDPPWADLVGRPEPDRIWWYGDAAGRQESVGLLFEYPDGPHAISVLVDHELGGGIRDCWLAEGPEAAGLPDRTAEVIAAEPGATFRELDPTQALDILRAAIARPVCAPEPHTEDVAICVELLRSRIGLLTAGVPA